MSKTNKNIGINLNRIRTARGMTLYELSTKVTNMGLPISIQTLSMIENGKRKMSAEQLFFLSKALVCSPIEFAEINEHLNKMETSDKINSLPNEHKEIIEYCFSEWSGDSLAMIKFMGLYMSLPMALRNMISGMGIAVYQYADKTGQVNTSAPKVDITYIIEAYRKLFR